MYGTLPGQIFKYCRDQEILSVFISEGFTHGILWRSKKNFCHFPGNGNTLHVTKGGFRIAGNQRVAEYFKKIPTGTGALQFKFFLSKLKCFGMSPGKLISRS